MITIISATNRKNSTSIKIARYYQNLLKIKGIDASIIDLSQIPHDFAFSALYDNLGKNDKFNEFVTKINQAEKFVFIVPEYNGSYPGVLKAFIDGLDFPASFKNKKCALVGLSSGVMAGALALSHLTDVLNYLGMHVLAVKPRLPRINTLFKDEKITDPFLESLLDTQADDLIRF
jgi:chromate reductase